MLLLNVMMMLRFAPPPPQRIILIIKERKRRKLARSRGRGVNGGTNCHRVYSFDESRNVFEECWFNGYNGYLFPSDFNLSFSISYEREYAYSISITISVIIICRFGV